MDQTEQARVARTTLIVLLIVGLALLTVQFAFVFLLIFSAILVAVLIRAAALPFRRMRVPDTPAVFLGLLVIFAVLGLTGWMFGAQLSEQFTELASQLPGAVESARGWLASIPFAQGFLSTTPDVQSIVSRALSFAFGAVGAITNLVLVVIAAIYLALDPQLYMRGTRLLFPRAQGPRVTEALEASGAALHRYLLAQFVTMLVIGALVWIGLAMVGVPSAGALGVISGLTNFIPLVGPFIGAAPGVLLAFSQSPEAGLWSVLVYFIAQQFEGNILTPMIQRYAVSIPPAVLLFALAALGGLFGFIGVIVSAPLAVVLYVLVNILWVRDTLGHEVPGEVERMEHKAAEDPAADAKEP